MGPHSDHFYCSNLLQDLVNKAVLDIDSARVSAEKVADKFLIRRRGLVRILDRMRRSPSVFPFKPAAAIFLASFCACFV